MKTHDNLWNEFISEENFRLAAARALQNKKKTAEIKSFIEDAGAKIEILRRAVTRGGFATSEYRRRVVFEPKRRELSILPFYPDRIIHHAFMNVLIPIWEKMFCRDSYACREGFGLHAASKRCMQFVRRNKYFLQCDVRKFYPSIHHDMLLRLISRKIRDDRFMAIIRNVVESTPGRVGIPIGNFCSQWFGNFYLNELDSFVKQHLRAADYLRYSDDFILFSNDKKQLGKWREEIRAFLADTLLLNFSYAEIAPVSCGADFVGYRHFPGRILLRKSTLKRIRRRLARIAAMPVLTDREVGQLAAANGWMKHASGFKARCAWLIPKKK